MKAEITEDGDLVLIPENKTELYAAKTRLDCSAISEFIDGGKAFIDTDYVYIKTNAITPSFIPKIEGGESFGGPNPYDIK